MHVHILLCKWWRCAKITGWEDLFTMFIFTDRSHETCEPQRWKSHPIQIPLKEPHVTCLACQHPKPAAAEVSVTFCCRIHRGRKREGNSAMADKRLHTFGCDLFQGGKWRWLDGMNRAEDRGQTLQGCVLWYMTLMAIFLRKKTSQESTSRIDCQTHRYKESTLNHHRYTPHVCLSYLRSLRICDRRGLLPAHCRGFTIVVQDACCIGRFFVYQSIPKNSKGRLGIFCFLS